jgi:hypothetical protein
MLDDWLLETIPDFDFRLFNVIVTDCIAYSKAQTNEQ